MVDFRIPAHRSVAMKLFFQMIIAFLIGSGAAGEVRFANAEITSRWVEGLNSRVRLVAGTLASGNLAGLEITLSPGWKTYWRNPGDGGVAPEFNWQGSLNVRDIQVLFPVPNRYTDEFGTSMGYENSVVFPVTFLPVNPLKPIILRLSVDYAVCEKLCIPAQAAIDLRVPGGVSLGLSPGLLKSFSRVPMEALESDARVINLQRRGDESLIFDVLFPKDPEKADVFAEGPASWFLPAPKEIRREKNKNGRTLIRYQLDLYGLPKAAEIPGQGLVFTILGGGRPVEQNWRLE